MYPKNDEESLSDFGNMNTPLDAAKRKRDRENTCDPAQQILLNTHNAMKGKTDIEEIFEYAISVAAKKYEDRGPHNIERYGPIGVFLRMSDKFARFETSLFDRYNMNEKNGGLSEEAVEKIISDSYDVINYCAFLIMLFRDAWGSDNSIPGFDDYLKDRNIDIHPDDLV